MVSKINFTLSQLSVRDLFLGYSNSNWNSRINYFLLGKRFGINLFNLNLLIWLKKIYFYISVKFCLKRAEFEL